MTIQEIVSKVTGQDTRLAELTSQIASLQEAAQSKSDHVAQLESDLATARQTIKTLGEEKAQVQSANEKLAADHKAALEAKDAEHKSALEAKDAELEKRANLKAGETLRGLGVAAVKEEAKDNPAAKDEPKADPNLKGLSRIRAAIKTQIAAQN